MNGKEEIPKVMRDYLLSVDKSEIERSYKEYEKDFLTLKFNIRGFLMPLMKQNNRYWKEWIYCFPELNWKFLGLKSKPLSIKVIFLITMMGLYPLFSKLRKLS